jgi:hypothetical protein
VLKRSPLFKRKSRAACTVPFFFRIMYLVRWQCMRNRIGCVCANGKARRTGSDARKRPPRLVCARVKGRQTRTHGNGWCVQKKASLPLGMQKQSKKKHENHEQTPGAQQDTRTYTTPDRLKCVETQCLPHQKKQNRCSKHPGSIQEERAEGDKHRKHTTQKTVKMYCLPWKRQHQKKLAPRENTKKTNTQNQQTTP